MYELDQHTKIDWALKMWTKKKNNIKIRRGGKNFADSYHSESAIRLLHSKNLWEISFAIGIITR